MSTEPPSSRKRPTATEHLDFTWRRDDEDDDPFPDELPLDSDEAFEAALDRALAPNPEDEADDDLFDRYSHRHSAADVERLAHLVAKENATEPAGEAEETHDLIPGVPHKKSLMRLAGVLVVTLGGLLTVAALASVWRLSQTVEQLEAKLTASVPPVPGALKAPTTGGGPSQTATLYGRHEELRTQIEQLRNQVANETLRLQGELRELAIRSEQRWQALEAGGKDLQRTPTRTVAALAPQPAANSPSPSPSASAPKPVTAQASKPSPSKPAGGPWSIALGSIGDPALAAQEVARLRELGVTAETQAVQTAGKTWHRVSVGGFPTREAAEAYASKAKGSPKLARVFADYWIGRR